MLLTFKIDTINDHNKMSYLPNTSQYKNNNTVNPLIKLSKYSLDWYDLILATNSILFTNYLLLKMNFVTHSCVWLHKDFPSSTKELEAQHLLSRIWAWNDGLDASHFLVQDIDLSLHVGHVKLQLLHRQPHLPQSGHWRFLSIFHSCVVIFGQRKGRWIEKENKIITMSIRRAGYQLGYWY